MTSVLTSAFVLTVVACGLLLVPERHPLMCPEDIQATWAEWRLRQAASNVVEPSCPPSVTAAESPAVTVSRLFLDLRGGVVAVDVVNAPSQPVRLALSSTLSQWRFAVPLSNVQTRTFVSGLLTFYLQRVGPSCRFLAPAKAPLFGEWPGGLAPRVLSSDRVSGKGGE
jgi:hypothetical protein